MCTNACTRTRSDTPTYITERQTDGHTHTHVQTHTDRQTHARTHTRTCTHTHTHTYTHTTHVHALIHTHAHAHTHTPSSSPSPPLHYLEGHMVFWRRSSKCPSSRTVVTSLLWNQCWHVEHRTRTRASACAYTITYDINENYWIFKWYYIMFIQYCRIVRHSWVICCLWELTWSNQFNVFLNTHYY